MSKRIVGTRRHVPVLLMAAAVICLSQAALAQPLEASVKAAFLGKFASYVQWPTARATDGIFNLCIVGEDPFGKLLEEATQGQQVNGRPYVVSRHLKAPRTGCHILYAGGSKQETVPETLKAVSGTPVLTVTDERRGAARGILHFALHENRVRFHINTRAATENGLSISSRLLSLALSVKSSWGRPLLTTTEHG